MQQVSDALKAELVAKLINHDLSVYEVAAQYHINPPTVYLWLREQGQLYSEAQLLTPEFFNLSGQAYYVVAQLGLDSAQATTPAASVAAPTTEAETTSAAAPAALTSAATEVAAPAATLSSDASAASDIAVPSPENAAALEQNAAPESAVAPKTSPEQDVVPEQGAALESAEVPESAAGEQVSTPVAAAPTMAFPTPETKSAELEDLNSKLGLSARPAAEDEAQADGETQTETRAAVKQPLRAVPLPEDDESEVEDDAFSNANWDDTGDVEEMELELPPSAPDAPKAATADAAAEESAEEDEELSAEEKELLLRRLERQEVPVNVISEAYDIPQFILYQWLKERKEQRAQAQAQKEAQERAAQEAAEAAKAEERRAAREAARATASGAAIATKERDGRGMKVSGDRKIRIVALATTGLMSNAMLAESFHVSVSLVSSLLREVREEGLLPWCLSLRKLDSEHPAAADLIAREQKEKQPEINFSQISVIKLAAVDAHLNQGLSLAKAATTFSLSISTLYSWVKKAKEQGFEAWAQSAGMSEDDLAWLKPRV